MSTAIVLMSRAPIPGRTKTRLLPHLTANEAALMHRAFLKDMTGMLLGLKELKYDISFYLAYTPQGKESLFQGLIPDEFMLFVQEGNDLGEKMYNCLNYVSKKHSKQLIIGSDLPTLQPGVVIDAINKLDEKDIVIGPSIDGGYYLLGLKEPLPFLFDKILWGESDVLKSTIDAIEENHGLSYGLVESWWDVDTYSDLLKLERVISSVMDWEFYPEETARTLANIIKRVSSDVKN